MSSSTTSDSLSKAYRLIEADELAAARAVLEPILDGDAGNADAWWLYAHAVTDTFAARNALDNVLRLNPNYPGAVELMEQLEVVSRSEAETEPLPVTEMAELDMEPVFDEDQFDDEDELETPVIAPVSDLREPVSEPSRRPWVPIAALVAIVAIVLLAALLLLQQNPADDGGDNVVAVPSPTVELGIGVVETEAVTEEPSEVAPPTEEEAEPQPVETETVVEDEPIIEEPTEAATEEEPPVISEPVEVMTEEATEEVIVDAASAGSTQVAMLPPGPDFTPLVDALADFSVAPSDVAEMETSLGETVVVTVCSASSATVRQNLPAVMDVIASRAAVIAGDAEAIGARLVQCETERPLIFVAVPKDAAVEYAVGNLTAEEFQASWRPQ